MVSQVANQVASQTANQVANQIASQDAQQCKPSDCKSECDQIARYTRVASRVVHDLSLGASVVDMTPCRMVDSLCSACTAESCSDLSLGAGGGKG